MPVCTTIEAIGGESDSTLSSQEKGVSFADGLLSVIVYSMYHYLSL